MCHFSTTLYILSLEQGSKTGTERKENACCFELVLLLGHTFDAGSGEGSANGAGRHFAELE